MITFFGDMITNAPPAAPDHDEFGDLNQDAKMAASHQEAANDGGRDDDYAKEDDHAVVKGFGIFSTGASGRWRKDLMARIACE
mgnify:CR=1 FL=1